MDHSQLSQVIRIAITSILQETNGQIKSHSMKWKTKSKGMKLWWWLEWYVIIGKKQQYPTNVFIAHACKTRCSFVWYSLIFRNVPNKNIYKIIVQFWAHLRKPLMLTQECYEYAIELICASSRAVEPMQGHTLASTTKLSPWAGEFALAKASQLWETEGGRRVEQGHYWVGGGKSGPVTNKA